jgi:CubicO group peptidase (beta-lactamase class C family)
MSVGRILPAVGLVMAVAAASPAHAQAPAQATARVVDHPKVAASLEVVRVWLDAARDYQQLPGLSAAVVHDQDALWIGGFGYADLQRKAPAAADTIYSICSISKLFTSIAVMQQRDAGKLRLDDPLRKHLPWFSVTQVAPEAGEVTLEGVLTHASGLPRESDQAYWTGPAFAFPTRDEIIAGLKNQTTLYPAETYFQYSNLGLTLAGEVAAAAAGQPYPALVRSRILDPLGLSSTFPEMPSEHRAGRLATGYGALGRDGTRAVMPFFEARGIAPAAGFASTAADLARFASWQFRLLAKGGTEVLNSNTLREMHRVHWVDPDFETTWGLGFSVTRVGDTTFVGHGGSCPGFRTQLMLDTAGRVATVFMTNAQGVDTGAFSKAMHELVAPAIKEATKTDAPAPKPADPSLEAYLGSYSSGFSGELAIVRWEDGLASLGLPTMDPKRGLTKLRKTGEHTFRRVRKNDALGEELVFEVGQDGKATRLEWHNNFYRRLK